MGGDSRSPEFRVRGIFSAFFVEIPGRAISGLCYCSRSGCSQSHDVMSVKVAVRSGRGVFLSGPQCLEGMPGQELQ